MSISNKLKKLLNQELESRKFTINLNASENYTSSHVKEAIIHPSYDFYPFPPAGGTVKGPWQFEKLPYLQQIDQHINQLGQELLSCEALDTRPKGGQAAEITLLTSLVSAGDNVLYVQESDGGHFGLNYISQKMQVNLIPITFNHQIQQIDVKKTITTVKTLKKKRLLIKLIMIGQSFILRHQPLRALVMALKELLPDCKICYDVSHTLGLIIGNQFPNPLLEGIDLIHGSTHKTFPGPQKAIIGFPYFFDKALREKIQYAVSPGLQSNCGTAETLALAISLEEMKVYGKPYAKAVCNHAKYLAKLLDRFGFSVVGKEFGYTETHQVWLSTDNEEKAWNAFNNLHMAGIRAYPAYLPFVKSWGLRLSTNGITRLGFEKEEIEQVANWIKEILIEQKSLNNIKKKVKALMQGYPIAEVKYSFRI